MSLSHLTLSTRDGEKTAAFFETTLGYLRDPIPGNVPREAAWLNVGHGQQIHLVYVDGFEVSPFEGEFGRHVAVYYPRPQFADLKQRLRQEGAELIEPLRTAPFERFFFRDPVNGYVFEVIDQDRAGRPEAK
jgi:catechol 2,3-dioxygenase-like lactoylglutathione lyase family enzyme